MNTKTDMPIKMAAGMGYAKLLSPAFAMEWIMIDGLRSKRSIAALGT